MNYQCHRRQADLTVGSMGCSKCGMRFAAPVPPLARPTAVPGVAAAPVTPSWVQPQPPQKSVADSVPRVPRPRQPLPPLEAPPLFEAKPPTVIPPSRRRKKRLIAAAVAVVVAGLLFTGIYNVWDTVFPTHPSSGYNEPTTAQAQAAFATDIPVTAAAPATAPVQQAAPAVPQMTDKQRADTEIAAAQGRYTADKAAQQQAAYAPSPSTIDEIPGGQARPIISNDQADQQMEALYDMGESSYQRSKSIGSGDTSMGVDGLGALVKIRKQMCALAPYVSPSRNAEFLHDYWLLDIRGSQEIEVMQFGPSNDDDTSHFMMEGGYTWGSEMHG